MAHTALRLCRSHLRRLACPLTCTTRSCRGCAPSKTSNACCGVQLVTARGLQIFDIFSKEKKEERRRALNDEMRRGYFDDFTDLKETGGRTFPVSEGLVPAESAPAFPVFTALRPDAMTEIMPPVSDAAAAVLVSIGFRNSSEGMLATWSGPFSRRFAAHSGARWIELSLVESLVMCLWPFRSIIMAGGAAAAARSSAAVPGAEAAPPMLPVEPVFHFGDATELRRALDMTNRLTGYVYLLDSRGRVRLRASGPAQGDEVDTLLQAAQQLLDKE